MKILAVLSLCLALVLAPYTVELSVSAASAPPFPYRTYEDAGQIQRSVPVCGGEAQYIVINSEWAALSSGDRDIFIHFGSDGQPDFAYFTVGVAGGAITVKRVLPVNEATSLYPDPCSYFTEKSA